MLRGLITDGNAVTGVEGDDLKENAPFRKTSSLVIDCTGVTSVLRTNLAINSYIQRKIQRDDLEATENPSAHLMLVGMTKTYFDPEYCIIHLDQNIAPGGYAWVFPKGNLKANIGLGVQQKALEQMNKKSGKNVNLKHLIDNYLNSNPRRSQP